MLDGKEVDGKIGEDGSYSVDVTDKGMVVIELAYEKDLGGAKVKLANSVTISLFAMLKKAAESNDIKWDDALLAGLEKALGIKKD